MGRSIALVNLERGLHVVLCDISSTALDQAAVALRQEVPADRQPLLTLTSSLAGLAACDLAIESVVESVKVKKQVFVHLETTLRPDAILASNTSCIAISQLAAGLATAGRLCGMHFCHPVRYRRLLEIVRGDQTTDETIALACAYARGLEREALLVKDAPGFVVNRILHRYLTEALTLLHEGAGVEEVDAAAVAFGLPWGPVTQIDEIGIDVVLRGGQILARAFPDTLVAPDLLIELFSRGRLGRKTGAGFYRYSENAPPRLDAEVRPLLAARPKRHAFSREQINRRLFGHVAEEAQRIVREGVVAQLDDVVRALVAGLGFPPRETARWLQSPSLSPV
jgi:3-hydroxyacyl-CoA dehydrogenase